MKYEDVLLHAAGTMAAAGCDMGAGVTTLISTGDRLGQGGVDVPHLSGRFSWSVTAAFLAQCLAAVPAEHQVLPLHFTSSISVHMRNMKSPSNKPVLSYAAPLSAMLAGYCVSTRQICKSLLHSRQSRVDRSFRPIKPVLGLARLDTKLM